MEIPEAVRGVLRRLERAGFDAQLVGGCVRDGLLGRPVHDWDAATDARPEQVMALFARTVPTGLRHGTVTVLTDGASVEVTTYRAEGTHSDRRRPDAVRFVRSLAEDLARRDFTINAMAMDLRGSLTDRFGGRQDLAAGIIRCVGEPAQRFREDALRMLRACRFCAQLGFSLETATERELTACAPLAAGLSAERVRDELEKTLCSPQPEAAGKLLQLGLARAVGLPAGAYDLSALADLPNGRAIRWAGFFAAVPSADPARLRLDGKTARTACAAAAIPPRIDSDAELKDLLAEHGEETVCIFCVLRGHTAQLARVLRSGACIYLRELAITGNDLPVRGPAIGALLDRLLRHVHRNPADNRREVLLQLAEQWSADNPC